MTQYLQATDSFSAGATSPPTTPVWLEHYIKLAPWSTDPAYGSGGTGYSITSAFIGECMLYTGWNTNPQSRGPRAAVSSGYVPQTAPNVLAFMPRWIEVSEVDVSCSIQVEGNDITHLMANGADYYAGVGARLSGGTPTGTQSNIVRLVGGDGYWFVLLHSAGVGGGKFQLLRVNSGTVTRLAESPAGALAFSSFASLASTRARTMRMTVAAEGSDVRIRCYTVSAKLSEEGEVVDPLFDVLDNSGSKITAVGRGGMLLSAEYQRTTSPARRVAPVCHWFQIVSGSTLLHRDEWVRSYYPFGIMRFNGAGATQQSEFLGYSLLCGWSGDYQYKTTPNITHDASNNRLTAQGNGFTRDLWWFSMRPADDVRVQDRQVTGRFTTSGGSANAAERHFGVFVRGTPHAASSDANPTACYYATIWVNDASSTTTITLRRRTTAQGDQILAEATSPTKTVDSDIILRLKVDTLYPDLLNGYARLSVWLDGTQVELGPPASPLAGVLIDSTGTVVDATSQRVTQGACEGIRVYCDNSHPRIMVVDTWALGPSSGSSVPENDQATIDVEPEYTSTVGTLELPIETSVRMVPAETTIRHELDLDHVYTGVRDDFERRVWDVEIRAMTADERDDLIDLHDDADGVVGAIDWTPPLLHDAATVVHFLDDALDIETIVPGEVFACRFRLEELNGA